MFLLILPLEWWLPRKRYQRLNDYVMFALYSPLLVITAALETRTAYAVRWNRSRRVDDDDVVEEWEQLDADCDFENDGWAKKVEATKPNVEVHGVIVETRKLKDEIAELRTLVEELLQREGIRGSGKDGTNGK
jgi:hypothetical protein